MNETVFFTLSDIDKGGIDTRQYILNSAEINITDLITTLGDDQFINTLITEDCRDPQLLSDDNLLLGHKREC